MLYPTKKLKLEKIEFKNVLLFPPENKKKTFKKFFKPVFIFLFYFPFSKPMQNFLLHF